MGFLLTCSTTGLCQNTLWRNKTSLNHRASPALLGADENYLHRFSHVLNSQGQDIYIAGDLSPPHLPLDGSNWMWNEGTQLCKSYLSRGSCRDFKLFTSRSMVQIWPRSGRARDLYNPTAAQRPVQEQFVGFRFWSCGRVPISSLALIGTPAWHTNKEAEDAPKRLNSPPCTPDDPTKGSTHLCAQACSQ